MDGITMTRVGRTFVNADGTSFHALDEVSLRVGPDSTVALVGASGSGKSTVARLVLGFEAPDEGSVEVDGMNPARLLRAKRKTFRRLVQGVFQDAGGTLNPRLSTRRNVEEALVNLTDLRGAARRARIEDLMGMVGLDRGLLDVDPRCLSGGEQRRLSLVRALSVRPHYLVLDEVTSGLDLIAADAVARLLEQIRSEQRIGMLFITHDIAYAHRLADRVVSMEAGRVVMEAARGCKPASREGPSRPGKGIQTGRASRPAATKG